MSFSDFYVNHRTRKSNFLNQIDHLIDWKAIEAVIRQHYAPASDVTGRPAYPGLLLFKMLLVGIWNGGLSDESVEDMANSNLHVMRFLDLSLGNLYKFKFKSPPSNSANFFRLYFKIRVHSGYLK